MSLTYIILGLIVVFVVFSITIYNRLIALRNNRENAFADIDVQLKQRHDLIPQLINTVKGYMKHESDILIKVTEARSNALSAKNLNEKIVAETQLSSAMQGLQIAVEAYPDLKANQNFMQLQEEISDIENKLAAARRFFNSSTKELNSYVEMFPWNIVAKIFNFKKEDMFDLGDKRKDLEETPEIDFK